MAEGLIERIGEEIDRRVDARLFGELHSPAQAPAPRARRAPVPGRLGMAPVFLALVSIGGGIGATVAIVQPTGRGAIDAVQALLVALIWIIIGAINISYARRP